MVSLLPPLSLLLLLSGFVQDTKRHNAISIMPQFVFLNIIMLFIDNFRFNHTLPT